ncbi:cytochrome P450 [Deinococcus sp. Leaf326]|uniref:cytochrome P450 n=1 Tax=Deinococcus sp. Leaf326 TaxID=1736338 RepID=UPI0006FB93E6|nr:cytochrome P450 [Deinococcus sp. Leaf326]KQR22984.1 cytochrome [Deinococcus sp. Leaf326]
MTLSSSPPGQDPGRLRAAEALWNPALLPDPYPHYETLRDLGGGLMFLPEWNGWFLTSHAAVSAVLRSPAARSGGGTEAMTPTDGTRLLQGMMLWRNGPSHQRLRGLVSAAFTPRVVEEQRDLVRGLLRELLASWSGRAEVDVVATLAHPLPARVIMAMLGLSGDDEARFVRWSNSVAELLGGAQGSPDLLARIDADAREMRGYFRDLVEELRSSPRPGLLSALAAAEDGGERLSGDELLSNAVLLLTAGHETTSNLIPGGLLELSRQPDAWAALAENPRHPGVADELLRVVSPVQIDGRQLTADLSVGEHTLRAGQFTQLLLGAANRDPAVFPEPARINWDRPNSARHLAFAAGPHYCLGASLARLEIAEVFAAIAETFPDLRVTDPQPPYKPNTVLRGPAELRVRPG